jgi:ribonuclease HII
MAGYPVTGACATPTIRPVVSGPIPRLKLEREAWKAGATWVAGVDEAGAGPLAGPVTAGVVALPGDRRFRWYRFVRDSKVLTPRAREELAEEIMASVPWALGWADHAEIDRVNIYQARRLCMLRALEQLPVQPDVIITDAMKLPLPNVRAVVDGDALSVAVGAASIIAKVARDAHMVEMCARYPGYGFCRHKGYATAEHRARLLERGPSPIHRRSFAPVAQFPLL